MYINRKFAFSKSKIIFFVLDLRHKLEKQKYRKLTQEEKRIFYTCCQDFIGLLFDDDDNAPSTTSSSSASKTKPSAPTADKPGSSSGSLNLNSKNKSSKDNWSSRLANGVSDQSKTVNLGKKAPASAILSSSLASVAKENSKSKRSLFSTPNTSADMGRSVQQNGLGTASPGSGGTPKMTVKELQLKLQAEEKKKREGEKSMQNGVNVVKKNTTNGVNSLSSSSSTVVANGAQNVNGYKNSWHNQSTSISTPTNSLQMKHASPKNQTKSFTHVNNQSKNSVLSSSSFSASVSASPKTSSIPPSLLSLHQQFVSGRMNSVSPAASKVNHKTWSAPRNNLDSSSPSSAAAARPASSATKRPKSALTSSEEESTPAKRSTPLCGNGSSTPTTPATTEWLSARRGGHSEGQGEGQSSRGRGRGKRGLGEVQGQRGRGQGRGRGRGGRGRGSAVSGKGEQEEEMVEAVSSPESPLATSRRKQGMGRGGR
jgi:hypothetical protein